MKKSGEVRRLAISHGPERSHRLNLRKGENHYWRRRNSLRSSQQRVGLTELFEPGKELCDLLSFTAARDVEVGGPCLKPSALQERRQIIFGVTTPRGQG